MTGVDRAGETPDPSWAPAELLERAEACTSLSAEWLVPLAALDPAGLSNDERASLALVMQRMTAVTEALALRALAAFPTQACRPDPALRSASPDAAARMCPGGFACKHHWHLETFSAISGLPAWHTDRRYGLAYWLADEWAPLWALLAAGRITLQHLERFDRAVSDANPEARAAAVAGAVRLIENNQGVSADSFGRSARRTVARHTDPAEAKVKQRDRVREQTGVTFEPLSDGLAALTLTGETHKLEAVRALLRDHPAVTRPADDDGRTRGQREVDLLVSLCLLGTGSAATSGTAAPGYSSGRHADTFIPGWAGSAAAAEPSVGLTITATMETLIGLSNEPGLVGDTTVSAALIRQWASDPTWVRLAILNHQGQVASVSRRRRFPAGLLAAAVRARWPRCTFPGCHRAAQRAHLDHADPHAHGGDTTLDNLHPLCPKHHLLKDQPGFGVRLAADNSAVWTLPGRRTVRVPAPDHRPPPGPHDGRPDDDWQADPPEHTGFDVFTDRQYEAWVADLIASDPEIARDPELVAV